MVFPPPAIVFVVFCGGGNPLALIRFGRVTHRTPVAFVPRRLVKEQGLFGQYMLTQTPGADERRGYIVDGHSAFSTPLHSQHLGSCDDSGQSVGPS
jgi:hypothetical protein